MGASRFFLNLKVIGIAEIKNRVVTIRNPQEWNKVYQNGVSFTDPDPHPGCSQSSPK